MPLAAGFVGIIPALGLLDEARDGVAPIHLSWWSAIAWSLAVAFFGYVFLLQVLSSSNDHQRLPVTATTQASRTYGLFDHWPMQLTRV